MGLRPNRKNGVALLGTIATLVLGTFGCGPTSERDPGAVVELVAGTDHTCALFEDGRMKCWGSGEYGALGYGNRWDIGDDETPADVGFVKMGGHLCWLPSSQVIDGFK